MFFIRNLLTMNLFFTSMLYASSSSEDLVMAGLSGLGGFIVFSIYFILKKVFNFIKSKSSNDETSK